ncbi:MAG: hypothetical protein ACK5GN_09345 [Pseudomonadota bacterium]|jgi:hypothetical protein
MKTAIEPQLTERLLEMKRAQLRQIARVLCPHVANGPLKALSVEIVKYFPGACTWSTMYAVSNLTYQYLDNSRSNRTDAIKEAVNQAIQNESDPQMQDLMRQVADSIRWEFLIRPDVQTLARWRTELGLYTTSAATTPQKLSQPDVVPDSTAFPEVLPDSLEDLSIQQPTNSLLFRFAGSRVLITPGPGTRLYLDMAKNGQDLRITLCSPRPTN